MSTTTTNSTNSDVYFATFPIAHQHFYTSPTRLSHALVNLRPLLPGHTLVIPHRTSAVHLADLTEAERADLLATVVRVQRTLRRVYSASSGAEERRGKGVGGGEVEAVGDGGGGEVEKEEQEEEVVEEGKEEGERNGRMRWRQARRPAGEVTAFNVAMQDGAAAGQTVPHVHFHVIPRREGDMDAHGGGDVLYRWLEGEEGNLGRQFEAATAERSQDAKDTGVEHGDPGGKSESRGDEEGGQGAKKRRGFAPDADRKDRSMAEMCAEAQWLANEMARDHKLGDPV
ncbi:MAG: hypothetical protein M1822_005697 [Bathelium mastoideum]|nr:MAG: hypothetical protein M1822_005697 [Bathelium mastoideum]